MAAHRMASGSTVSNISNATSFPWLIATPLAPVSFPRFGMAANRIVCPKVSAKVPPLMTCSPLRNSSDWQQPDSNCCSGNDAEKRADLLCPENGGCRLNSTPRVATPNTEDGLTGSEETKVHHFCVPLPPEKFRRPHAIAQPILLPSYPLLLAKNGRGMRMKPSSAVSPSLDFPAASFSMPIAPTESFCPPFMVAKPLASCNISVPRPLNPTLSFTGSVFIQTHTPSVNLTPVLNPATLFAQTFRPEEMSHSSKGRSSSSRHAGAVPNSFSTEFGEQMTSRPVLPAGWLGSESLYSGRRGTLRGAAVCGEVAEQMIWDEHMRTHKTQRSTVAKASRHETDKGGNKQHKPVHQKLETVQSRASPYQQPLHKPKNLQLGSEQPQRQHLDTRQHDRLQRQESALVQKQQELSLMLQQLDQERKKLHQQQHPKQGHQTQCRRLHQQQRETNQHPETPFRWSHNLEQSENNDDLAYGTENSYPGQEGEISDIEDMLSSCCLPALSPPPPMSPASFTQQEENSEVVDGHYHFDGCRMAPAQNDNFDFFMAEAKCNNTQSDTEDSNLSSLLQQNKSSSLQEPQHRTSDMCGVSDTAEGLDLMCYQSSTQLTTDEDINKSRIASVTGPCEMSPSQTSIYMNHRPQSVSSSSVEAKSTPSCDVVWLSGIHDESMREACLSPDKGEKKKVTSNTSPQPGRQVIANYQTMTPWTNENLTVHDTFPSPSQDIPCFSLDIQTLREQSLNGRGPMHCSSLPVECKTGCTAAAGRGYSFSSSAPYCGRARGSVTSKRNQNQLDGVAQITREKRFRKTAEALRKCGLWDIALKTGNLIKRNAELQHEIERFRAEAAVFLKAVVQNPENKELMESLTTGTPLTLNIKARLTDCCESYAATTTACTGHNKVSDCNSSITSGYASYTEGSSNHSSPDRK